MDTLEKAHAFFAHDTFATETTGIEIDAVGEHYARCSLMLDARHKNAAGHVMGGAIFTLADFTFAVASNFDQPLTVTAVSQISYLGSPKGTRLIAESELLRDGKRACYYLIHIVDDLGNDVASVTSTGMHLNNP